MAGVWGSCTDAQSAIEEFFTPPLSVFHPEKQLQLDRFLRHTFEAATGKVLCQECSSHGASKLGSGLPV